MMKKPAYSALAAAVIALLVGCSNNNEPAHTTQDSSPPKVNYPYSTDTPLTTPTLFEEQALALDQMYIWSFSFSPDGQTIYLQLGNQGSQYDIYESKYVNGAWQTPKKPAFTQELNSPRNGDVFVTPDGSQIFLVSNDDLYVADRTTTGVGKPKKLKGPVNTANSEYLPSVASNGNLYFEGVRRPEGPGQGDLYVSLLEDGEYREVKPLGETINTTGMEESPYIAPDESFLIFIRDSRMMISYQKDGEWAEPEIMLGDDLSMKYSPYVTPDQKYLFYTSSAGGRQRIYQVDFQSALPAKK